MIGEIGEIARIKSSVYCPDENWFHVKLHSSPINSRLADLQIRSYKDFKGKGVLYVERVMFSFPVYMVYPLSSFPNTFAMESTWAFPGNKPLHIEEWVYADTKEKIYIGEVVKLRG